MSGVLAFGLTLFAKATLVLAVAALLDALVLKGRTSAALRHLLWAAALGILLLLPIASLVVPAWTVPLGACLVLSGSANSCEFPANAREFAPRAVQPASLPPSASVLNLRQQNPATKDSQEFAVDSHSFATSHSQARGDATPGKYASWITVTVNVYAAVALLLLLRMLAQRALVRRLERSAQPLHDAMLEQELHTLASLLGIRRRIAMLRGDSHVMPMTWGLLRSAILLPASADGWTSERRRAVLLHELAHVARHDCLTQTLASLACAIYWPHPGAWWAASRLREERELACDDQALAQGIGPHDYAEHLLEIAVACRVPAGTRDFAVSMAAPSHLETRLLAAIDDRRPRGTPSARLRLALPSLALAVLVPLAAVRDGVAAQTATPRAVQQLTPANATEFGGQWVLRLTDIREAPNSFHVMLLTPGMNTFYAPASAFTGLSLDDVRSATGAKRFTLRRDAGTLTFDGTFASGQGRGRFTFTGSEAFAGELAKRGIQRPTPERLFSLGRHDVTLTYLDELAAQGYATPSIATLDRAGMSGADLDYLKEMAALGYKLGTVEALLRASDQGVSPEYIRAVEALGYGRLPMSQLIAMRNHSLEAGNIVMLNGRAGRRLSPAELVAHPRLGEISTTPPPSTATPPSPPFPVSVTPLTTPTPATPPSSATPALLTSTSDTPLAGRWTVTNANDRSAQLELFWTDGTNWRRGVMLTVLRGLDAGVIGGGSVEPVAFAIEQDAGRLDFTGTAGSGRASGQFRFTPNRAFAATLRTLGVRDVRDVSDHTLKNFTWGGMSASNVRELRELGYADVTMEELTDLAVRMVTPAWARGLKEAGVRDLTVRNLEDLRMANVTPEYAREMATVGYRDATARDLIELRQAGVTATFVRGAIPSGAALPSPEEMARLARNQRRGR